jgi:exodeoxyribonuclease VII small subunit
MPPILEKPGGPAPVLLPQQPSLEIEMAENQNAGTNIPAEIAALSFEEALAQLQDLVKKLERGDNKLDEAISSYERGALLKQHCEAKLREAQMKVEKIVLGANGSVGTQPMDTD